MLDIIIPKMGMATVEVDLVKWHVSVGAAVQPGTLLAEVESEKTTIEIESEVAGAVTEILVPAGETTEVGTVICRIQEAG